MIVFRVVGEVLEKKSTCFTEEEAEEISEALEAVNDILVTAMQQHIPAKYLARCKIEIDGWDK